MLTKNAKIGPKNAQKNHKCKPCVSHGAQAGPIPTKDQLPSPKPHTLKLCHLAPVRLKKSQGRRWSRKTGHFRPFFWDLFWENGSPGKEIALFLLQTFQKVDNLDSKEPGKFCPAKKDPKLAENRDFLGPILALLGRCA